MVSDDFKILSPMEMLIIKGAGVSPGIAIGILRFLKKEPVKVRRVKIDDAENEIARFENARDMACSRLGELYQNAIKKTNKENATVFEIHKMMLEDPDFRESVTDIISAQKVNAEFAICQTAEKFAGMFSSMDNVYMQGRAADVFDICDRIQKALRPEFIDTFELNMPSILIARDITPGEAVQFDKSMVLGFATVDGTANSHTSILARSMGIPVVIGVDIEPTEAIDGKPAILDGINGVLYIDPDVATSETMSGKLHEIRKKHESVSALKGRLKNPYNGKRIDIFVNVNNMSDLDAAIENDADGIGLFRSEYLYLESSDYPTEDEQFVAYKRVAERMNGKKAIIRTLDIGADKQAAYFNLPREENPAMGLRGIRVCLTRPEILKTQARAIYRASAFGNVAIMFPMIISTREVEDILKITEDVMADLRRENAPFNEKTERGIMIETPAAVMISGELAKLVDFFSIGTNDLTQYALAIDRQNGELGSFYDPHHPAILKMIEMTVKSAHEAGIPVGICGELGADLELTETFLQMGVDELSVSPGVVPDLTELVTTKLILNYTSNQSS